MHFDLRTTRHYILFDHGIADMLYFLSMYFTERWPSPVEGARLEIVLAA